MENKTAQELRQMAADCYQQKQESWERSDTDGFLTQWASGLSASLYIAQAEIVENGGKWEFPGLFDVATGNRVPAKQISCYNKFAYRHETRWALFDPETGKLTGVFYPCGDRSRKLKAAGLIERPELVPAKAEIVGQGTGLSGSAWVVKQRTDGGCPPFPVASLETQAQPLIEWAKAHTNASYGVQTTSGVSKNGRAFFKISFGVRGLCDASIDFYSKGFLILRASGQRQGDVYNMDSIWTALKTLEVK